MRLTDISLRLGKIVQSLVDPGKAHGTIPEEFVLGGHDQLDSVWVLRLVIAMEKEFEISIEDGDVKPENFQDLQSLAQFVARKLSSPEVPGT